MPYPSRILITGSTGFVGGYLLEACRTRYPDATLFGLVGRSSQMPPLREHVQLLIGDITDRTALRAVVARAQPDLVFHLAAQASVPASWNDPIATLRTNVEGTIQLFETFREEQMKPRIVLVGSGEQYGMIRPEDNPINEDCPQRPANPYAISKAAQDLYGHQYYIAYGLPIIRARPFNHFGPRQSTATVIPNFARQIAQIETGTISPTLGVGNLQARRDFLPVEDVVNAYLALAERGHPGEAYNIGSGQPRSIRSILDLLLTMSNKSIQVYEDPARYRPVDVPLLQADTALLQAHTDWQPSVPFEDALHRTLNYWREIVASES